jgi:type I restriction enzyme, S subunit
MLRTIKQGNASLVDSIVHAAHGSVFNTITTRTIESASAIIPGNKILERFEGIVGPLFMRALANLEESRALAKIRDLLLPRLLSGEVRVKTVSGAT